MGCLFRIKIFKKLNENKSPFVIGTFVNSIVCVCVCVCVCVGCLYVWRMWFGWLLYFEEFISQLKKLPFLIF